MAENGSDHKTNVWREITGQIADHIDLAALELHYETRAAGKRFFAAAVILVLVLTGFLVLQVALVGALMRAGLTMGLASLLLSLVYFAAALAVFWKLGRRDKQVGPPFVGTQREIHQTLRWIQKIFS